MAMDFWKAQRKSRRWTAFYIALFAAMTLLAAAGCEWLMRMFDPDYGAGFPIVGFGFLIVTFAVAAGQYIAYKRNGGSYVAESVGGRLIERSTRDFKEQQLLNIVQELSIAASVPVPAVYIIPAEQINAFAAGTNLSNSVIAVTEGTLNKLNRDELAGVIGHELGHVRNGDMTIGLRLAAMVMGFSFLLYTAMRFMQSSSYGSSYGGGGFSHRRVGNPFSVLAFVLMIAGGITSLFGSMLKATVSREREYLADASAVQFTRDPSGIANALRKIARDQASDMPREGMTISHMYIDDRGGLSNLFATHPPLAKRIAALEGREYIPEEWQIP
jgi:heat shock protein HtpX